MTDNRGTIRAAHAAMVDDRRARLASFKVQGFSIRQSADKMEAMGCVNPKTGKKWGVKILDQDLQLIQARWKEAAVADIAIWKAKELSTLDELEQEAWKAWFRSIGEKHSRFVERVPGADATPGTPDRTRRATLRTETEDGDPRYMDIILRCCSDRRKLLGLDAPIKSELTGKDGAPLSQVPIVLKLIRQEAPPHVNGTHRN